MLYRPQDLAKRYTIRLRLAGYNGTFENHNFRSRTKWYPAGWGFNKKVIGNQFGKLHYLACHSPKPIQKKWSKVYDVFHKKYFGSYKTSVRYLNRWSCHSWL